MLFILIPGLLLVALMVYASTRIKRSVAQAFEAETVETEDFVIQKPDGFLNVINGDPQYAFEAYSKDFGEGDAQEFRQGTAKLTIRDGSMLDAAVVYIKKSGQPVSDLKEVIGETHYRLLEIELFKKQIEFRALYKLAESNSKVYELEVTQLVTTTDDFARKIDLMVDSFEIK